MAHDRSDQDERRPPSPGYLWRPGVPTNDGPLLVMVALVVGMVLVGAVLLGMLT